MTTLGAPVLMIIVLARFLSARSNHDADPGTWLAILAFVFITWLIAVWLVIRLRGR